MSGPSVRCDQCGGEVPAMEYCVRCGVALSEDQESAGRLPIVGRQRRSDAFAAAPEEPLLAIRVVSTLFPHLPRSHAEAFRWSLIIATVAMVTCAATGLYSIGLVVSALAVPILMVLYLFAVDVYEDEPIRVIAFTVAWGAIAGLLIGLLGRTLAPPTSLAITGSLGSDLVTTAVVLPLVGAALAAIGPLLLLGYRKFNDVLDGTTFGAVAGASFVGAQALVTGIEVLTGGLRPPGDPSSWIVRLLALGVVTPILWTAVLGGFMGVCWLRYRSPTQDRAALGALGHPVVAGLAAGVVLSAAAIGQLVLDQLLALGWLTVLAGVALVWLRNMIHLGLLEEAAEIEIGPPIRCANCGRSTPHHTFCAHCGIALRALPKVRHAGRLPSDEPPGGRGRDSASAGGPAGDQGAGA